jgi:ABC-type nitrate/sulfonate/bicarbonate transport system permease component
MPPSKLTARSIQLGAIVLALGIWYAATRTQSVRSLFFPPLDRVWDELVRLAQAPDSYNAIQITLLTIAKAYSIAVVLGILIAYLVTRSRWLTKLFEPLLSSLFAVPITLFFPLFILFFGIGANSKVAYGAAYGVFPIALSTIAGFSAVDSHFVKAARSMGANGWEMFRHVLLPSAMPVVFSGLRVGLIICFTAVLGGETLSSIAGIGRKIALSAELLETARMYAWILFVVVLTASMNGLLSMLEAKTRDY